MNAPLEAKLMLVEDERIVAFDLKNQLQALGYRVGAVVASGEEAVARVGEVAPDLVLMDIHLEGGLDGIDAAVEIQSRYRIPVIFLTAYAEDETLRRALDSRPFGYLIKPCEARELHAMIQTALARRQVEVAVEQSERRLQLALDAASLGVLEWHPATDRLRADGHLGGLFGDRPVPIDESWQTFVARIFPEDRGQVLESLTSTLSGGRSVRLEFRTAANHGAQRYLEAHAKAYAASGGDERVLGIIRDITQRRADEERLRQSSVVFHTTAEAIVITDAAHLAVAANQAFLRITGFAEEEVIGRDPDALLHISRDSSQFFERLAAGGDGYWQGEVPCRRRGGEPFPSWQSLSTVRDAEGRVTHFVIAFSDVTDIHLAAQKLDHLAHHDPLTGLPNRLLFDDRFEHALEQARRDQERCLLLFLDLDSFKVVNDTLGHEVGDELLRVVGGRLSRVLRHSDTIARLGGDEFVVLAGSSSPDYAAHVAQKILDVLREPIELNGEQLTVSGSIGISLFPDHGGDRQSLMRAADIAMYAAKTHGRNRYHFYTDDMSARSHERLRMEQGLRRAIESDGLAVHYQPQVALADGRLVGVEALVRWPHPELGMIAPDRFIPVAEESGIIDKLGRWVLRQACNEVAGLLDDAGRQLRVAVNVSAREFLRDDFSDTVRETLEETGFPGKALELEITESTLQAVERSAGILTNLKALGISVSIDDFGTGYSSLSVLRDLPVDRIKIDRSFIVELPHKLEQVAMVEAVVGLARALRMGIVVEGIERREQAEVLARLGCDEGQGFLFCRALGRGDLLQWLDERGVRLRC